MLAVLMLVQAANAATPSDKLEGSIKNMHAGLQEK